MKEYIECRYCDSKSCAGCNIFILSNMLRAGKFDEIMDEHYCINPAADVVERKRGERAIDKEDLEWGNALKRRYCTNCKKRPHFDKEKRVFVLTDFCPHCGADMRGEDDG